MKINILDGPPADLFKYRKLYVRSLIFLMAVAGCGILIGGYAIVANTGYYPQLETLALILFVAPAPVATFFGQKLQNFKRLTPPQKEKLAVMGRAHPEIKSYCDQVSKLGRRPIRAEYEACRAWTEVLEQEAE